MSNPLYVLMASLFCLFSRGILGLFIVLPGTDAQAYHEAFEAAPHRPFVTEDLDYQERMRLLNRNRSTFQKMRRYVLGVFIDLDHRDRIRLLDRNMEALQETVRSNISQMGRFISASEDLCVPMTPEENYERVSRKIMEMDMPEESEVFEGYTKSEEEALMDAAEMSRQTMIVNGLKKALRDAESHLSRFRAV